MVVAFCWWIVDCLFVLVGSYVCISLMFVYFNSVDCFIVVFDFV